MDATFKELKTKGADVIEWLKKELLAIQTGRATPAVFDSVLVESYGAKVPVKQVANIAVEDARTLRVVPYNSDDIRMLEQAITDADLGVGVGSDEKGVRVNFPALTTETREKYIKLVGKKLEEARISLRGVRDDVWNELQDAEQKGDIGKDEKFKLKEKMEDTVKKINQELENLALRKEKDICG